jgi:hypothetical protein
MQTEMLGVHGRPHARDALWGGEGMDLSFVSSAENPAGWRSSFPGGENFSSRRDCAPLSSWRCAVFARFNADMILFFARSSLPELPGTISGGAAPSGVEGGERDARSMLPCIAHRLAHERVCDVAVPAQFRRAPVGIERGLWPREQPRDANHPKPPVVFRIFSQKRSR